MANKIEPEKLEALRAALIDGMGDITEDQKKAILGDVDLFDDYYDALAEKYPDEFDREEEAKENPEEKKEGSEAPQTAPAAKKAATKQAKTAPPAKLPSKVILEMADGTSRQLELVTVTTTAIVVKEIVPKDEVVIKIRGKDVTVDLVVLRKLPATQNYENTGIPVLTVIQLAEAARG